MSTYSISLASATLRKFRLAANVSESDIFIQQYDFDNNKVRIVWRINGTSEQDLRNKNYYELKNYDAKWFNNDFNLFTLLCIELPFMHRYSAVLGDKDAKPKPYDVVLSPNNR